MAVAEPADARAHLVPVGLDELMFTSGAGAVVTDVEGGTYVDLEGGPGVASVGHSHPKVAAAIADQASTLLQGPGKYLSTELVRVASRLAALTNNRLGRVMFANSGAEANEGAIKLALRHAVRRSKGGFGLMALEHGFHGRLSLPLALTGMAERKRNMATFPIFPGVVHVPAPYCYRCPLGMTYPKCGIACANAVGDKMLTAAPGDVVALIGEPILGVGGVIVPPVEYWPGVEAICRENDVTLIHDEVFTGFGRTGRMFGHEHFGTQPDAITFAKAIAAGVPLGGVLATEELGTAFDPGDHFTTFGSNNQIGLRAANTVLDILQEERLPERADMLGKRFMVGLTEIERRYEHVGEVRGLGLMIGIEVVIDKASRRPNPTLAKQVQKDLRKAGYLVSVAGVYNCVLRITPPIVISEAQVDGALEAIEQAFARAV